METPSHMNISTDLQIALFFALFCKLVFSKKPPSIHITIIFESKMHFKTFFVIKNKNYLKLLSLNGCVNK